MKHLIQAPSNISRLIDGFGADMSKALVSDIVKYFEDAASSGKVASDDMESIEIAIDTIKEVFGVEAGSNDLAAIYERGLSSSGSAKSSTGDATPTNGAATPQPISEETKRAAEEKKVAGNTEMARKNYEQAINLYTEAITLYPDNPLYYSNRAAAYSQANKPSLAVADARRAISLDPKYSKAYSRLGLALYTLGDSQGALNAYEQGLKAEGDSPSEGMKRGYETVKSRIESEGSGLTSPASSTKGTDSPGQSPGGGFGGLSDLGGMGGLSSLLSNPEIKNMASKMMSNPSMMANLMNSPAAKSIQNQFGGEGGGGMPDISKLMSNPDLAKMMNDPMIQNMAKQFMGGENNNSSNN